MKMILSFFSMFGCLFSTISAADANSHQIFDRAAQGIAACYLAAGEVMPLTFDETGECPGLPESIWLVESVPLEANLSSYVSSYIPSGTHGEGEYVGTVTFEYQENACRFTARLSYSGEDVLVRLDDKIRCQ